MNNERNNKSDYNLYLRSKTYQSLQALCSIEGNSSAAFDLELRTRKLAVSNLKIQKLEENT